MNILQFYIKISLVIILIIKIPIYSQSINFEKKLFPGIFNQVEKTTDKKPSYFKDPYKNIPNYTDKRSTLFTNEQVDSNIYSYGFLNLNLFYGKSFFTNEKYKQFDEDTPSSNQVKNGFLPEQNLLLFMEGTIGKRIKIFINHDSQNSKDNYYLMQYRAVEDDEILREINAGDIFINFNHSKYATYENKDIRGIGIDATVKKNNLKVKAFGTIALGKSAIEHFRGNSKQENYILKEFQYQRKQFYQIEPYLRYGKNPIEPPYSENYTLNQVSIKSNNFAIYLDDQNSYNNHQSITLNYDSGNYDKLRMGIDYIINYSTGLIEFKKTITESSRIFILYNLTTLSSTDDAVSNNVQFPGHNFVFIKYGPSIIESTDINGDGKISKDVYEVKSFYNLGNYNISETNFSLQIRSDNGTISSIDKNKIGDYTIDYKNGLIKFNSREPFKEILNSNGEKIYNENQINNIYLYSKFTIVANFYSESSNFKLKNGNIIKDSVIVKIDGKIINKSRYNVDYETGLVIFNDSNSYNFSTSNIEIKYEYSPVIGQNNSIVSGIRTDYKINKNLSVGQSILYTSSPYTSSIPDVNNAPTSTVVLEADTSITLKENDFTKIYDKISNKKRSSIPLQFNGYLEYAKSFKKSNTFGKAMIDNMESNIEITSISLSEKDWILSSPLTSHANTNRGKLFYNFFRDPYSPTTLEGEYFTSFNLQYSDKPGPYNVATGHIPTNITELSSQKSLVLDFDFSSANFVSIATRSLNLEPVDFSGLQYIEFSYKYEGATSIDLVIDIGKINEDSDNDGVLDNEDINNNGYIDSNPDQKTSEDRGYLFNPIGCENTTIGAGPNLSSFTAGDGILNSEDLNNNGYLDLTETIVSKSLQLSSTNNSWMQKRIYFDPSTISQNDLNILLETEAIRLSLTNGPTQGKLYIDEIKFVSTLWKHPTIDNYAASNENLKVTTINKTNDSAYENNSFINSNKDFYSSLYGINNNQDLESIIENSIQIEYNIAELSKGEITRTFITPIDISNYNKIHGWFNFRDYSNGDKITLKLASSENDYLSLEYTINANKNSWEKIDFEINSDSAILNGDPDLKRIKYIKILIESNGTAGKFWLNEIYLSDADTLVGDAHWYEAEIKLTRPFYKTKNGTSIMKDFTIKYIKNGYDENFSTLAKDDNQLSLDRHQISTFTNILPNLSSSIDYQIEKTNSYYKNFNLNEELRGKSKNDKFNFILNYKSNNYIPSILFSYSQLNKKNKRYEDIDIYKIDKETNSFSKSPTITLTEKFENFLSGYLLTKIMFFTNFTKDETFRNSDSINISTISNSNELEKTQHGKTQIEIDYSGKYLFIRPHFLLSSNEYVAYKKNSDNNEAINKTLNGSFHFPFIYNKNMKFINRNYESGISFGTDVIKYISPNYKLDLKYDDFNFNDQSFASDSDKYTRRKDALSQLSTTINVPIYFNKVSFLKFIKTTNINFNRSVNLQESNIPYENESTSIYNENYGINRSLGKLLNNSINLFSKPPGYYFFGRNSFSNTRDFSNNSLNENYKFSDGTTVPDYTNNILIRNNAGINSNLVFHKFNVNASAEIISSSERINIQSTPTQVVSNNYAINFEFNLMKYFNFSFFRPNNSNLPFHSSFLTIGHTFSQNKIITSNILENTHSPFVGLLFKWSHSSLNINNSLTFIKKNNHIYIPLIESERDRKDDIYFNNLTETNSFSETDKSYEFNILYKTDVKWIYNIFTDFYKLTANPMFTLGYNMKLNRYNYTETVSPEPYDLYMIFSDLSLNLHKHVKGGIESKLVLEKFRNRSDNIINKEIFSFEVGFNFSLLF